jgi:dTDP-4-amino-4,6-dideoxygalactose transaminase
VNSRLDPLQAAILRVKLAHLDTWNERRRMLAAAYGDALADTGLTLPRAPNWADHVWHLYVVRSAERDALQSRLTEAGIGTLIHYPIPPHRQEAYADLAPSLLPAPLAEALAEELVSLPIGPHLSGEQHAEVLAALRHVLAS